VARDLDAPRPAADDHDIEPHEVALVREARRHPRRGRTRRHAGAALLHALLLGDDALVREVVGVARVLDLVPRGHDLPGARVVIEVRVQLARCL
jgi:hypothetical protein